jgi:Site-specific recombinase XerD
MGSVSPYETAAGRRDRVRYRKPDHAQTDKRGFKTKRDAELFLAAVLDFAIRNKTISVNQARGTDLPRKNRREHIYLSHQQVAALAGAGAGACRQCETLILVLAYTGIRWGETTALRVQDVDLTRRRLNIVQNAIRVGMEVIVGTPKTGGKRSVGFPPFLEQPIRDACATHARANNPPASSFPTDSVVISSRQRSRSTRGSTKNSSKPGSKP